MCPTSTHIPRPTAHDAFAEGWSLDYASSNPTFVVGIADWWGIEESGYSTDGGQTWHAFPTELPGGGQSFVADDRSEHADQLYMGACRPVRSILHAGWRHDVAHRHSPGVSNWNGFDSAYYFNTRTVTADRVLPNTFYLYYAGSAPGWGIRNHEWRGHVDSSI